MKRMLVLLLACLLLASSAAPASGEPAAEILPAYTYTGEDPLEEAILSVLQTEDYAGRYYTEPGSVMIPCPLFLKTEMTGDGRATVYCSVWLMNYVKQGTTLVNISGGENPLVITLEKTDGVWQVTALEEAGEGDDYYEDITRFADGDEELENKYHEAADLMANEETRTQYIRAYVKASGLDITAYQDYGWDPVELN